MSLSTASYAGAGTITQSTNTVTGSSTAFLSEVKVGDVLTADAGSPLISGTVTAIASDTSLTLSTSATQAAGQTYKTFPQAGVTDRVSQWNDLTGKFNFTQATASKRPALSGGTVSFDGADDLMQADAMAAILSGADVPISFIVVAKPNVVTGDQDVLDFTKVGAGNPTVELQITGSKYKWVHADDASAGANVVEVSGTANTSKHVQVWVYTGTAISLFIDGVVNATLNAAADDIGQQTFTSAGHATLGARFPSNTASQWWPGTIDAVLAVNRALTAREVTQATRYFGRRAGIGVAA